MAKKITQPKSGSLDVSWCLNLLKKNYPDAHCALNFNNPFQLMVATILSAQCTDERVNIVTKDLFKTYKKPSDLADEDVEVIETAIRSTGFYKNKAKNIKANCQILKDKYNNQVPQTLEELVALPGIGRKTANVVLGNAFGIATGVVVDTHVTRLANRFGWVKIQDAVKIEQKLNTMFDQSEWIMLSHYLISHGRAICKARSPDCENCFLATRCPRKGLR
ncbi:MAG: endonuclease III [Pseudobdellovibrio sp.]|nr:endonuclease III [Pseudobdellovibrio sp.]